MFEGLGEIKGVQHKIQIDPNATPVVVQVKLAKDSSKLQWATKVLRHFVILEYLRQISFLISTILPPPPFSMLDFLSLEFASFLYNIEKGVGGWLSK